MLFIMKHVWQHMLQILITLIGVTFITFCLTWLAPGDPALMVLEVSDTMVSQELIDETRREMGLDQPFLVQYVRWVEGAVQGDLGMSFSSRKPVTEKLIEAFPATLLLALLTILIMLLTAVPLGVLMAVYKNKWIDYVLRGLSFVGISMPAFWLGLILLYVFGLKLGLFPIASATVTAKGAVLPAITLAVTISAKYMRQVRLVVLEEYNKDYVIGARTRGMSERRILFRHVLPNALLPLITLLGLAIGWLMGGVAVVEMIFSWPGLGKMAIYAITMRDYPLVEGFVLWTAIAYMIINGLVDLSYTRLNPQSRKGGES